MPVVSRMTSATIRRDEPRGDSVPRRGLAVLKVSSWHRPIWGLILTLLWCQSAGAAGAAGVSERLAALQQQYDKSRTLFASELEVVAVNCDQAPGEMLAAEIRQLKQPFDPQGNSDKLPDHIQPAIPVSLPEAERTARVRVRKLRTDYAVTLFNLSRKAVKDQHASFAYRLVREVLWHDPDHPQARELLGFRRVNDEWTTSFAIDMKKQGKVWHHDFGWIDSKHVARYEAGERFYNGKWMTAAKEETIRSDFKNAWVIETEHFHVRTNYRQKKGVQLATAVEVFHRYFMREFAAFFKTPQQLDKLFASGTASSNGDLYEIYHFRLQQEFVDRLAANCPVAGQINGLYLPEHRRAYFFHNPKISEEESMETLYHEVTHQLLSESTRQTIPVGHERDFWVIEGIACYFESFHVSEDGAVTVGDIHHPRVMAARDQVVVTQDQVPLDRFTASGMLRFQTGETPVLQQRYAQATGLTHFFLHYQNGIYRDGFIEYLTQIYSPNPRVRAKAQSLEQILKVTNATLDAQYASYFKQMPSQPLPISKASPELSLPELKR